MRIRKTRQKLKSKKEDIDKGGYDMKKYLLLVFALAVAIMSPCISLAQEQDQEQEVKYGSGVVESVNEPQNEITVNEYDFDTDSEKPVKYSVSPGATFENVISLKEIAAGDDVEIEYTLGGGGIRIADFISIYKNEHIPEPEEDISPETEIDFQ